ncbi:MAG TPA: TetR/AcrR family transcriptional regulator [Sphingobium sp.]
MTTDKAQPPKRDRASADRLIEAAEQLFGRLGLDGSSMRQIQLAAGSSNKYAVQYHFGSIAGLVEAILARRMPVVDAAQARLLEQIEAEGRLHDVGALLDAFFRPLLEQANSQGERTYARFLSAMLVSEEGERHFEAMLHLAPTTGAILQHLRAAIPHVSADRLARRLRLITGMVCTSMFSANPKMVCEKEAAIQIEDTLKVATAGLCAPS